MGKLRETREIPQAKISLVLPQLNKRPLWNMKLPNKLEYSFSFIALFLVFGGVADGYLDFTHTVDKYPPVPGAILYRSTKL